MLTRPDYGSFGRRSKVPMGQESLRGEGSEPLAGLSSSDLLSPKLLYIYLDLSLVLT